MDNEDCGHKQLKEFVRRVDSVVGKSGLQMKRSGYRMDIGCVCIEGIWRYVVSELQPLEGDASFFHAYLKRGDIAVDVGRAIGREYINQSVYNRYV